LANGRHTGDDNVIGTLGDVAVGFAPASTTGARTTRISGAAIARARAAVTRARAAIARARAAIARARAAIARATIATAGVADSGYAPRFQLTGEFLQPGVVGIDCPDLPTAHHPIIVCVRRRQKRLFPADLLSCHGQNRCAQQTYCHHTRCQSAYQ